MQRAIEDHALIGDGRCGALVARDGAIDWMSAPRFDAPPLFAALLGNDGNGVWRLAPVGSVVPGARRYVANAPILETTLAAEGGTVRLTDFFVRGAQSPHVVRIVEGVAGMVPVRSDLIPRPDWGRIVPRVEQRLDGSVLCEGAGDALVLRASVPLVVADGAVLSQFALRPGERAWLTLGWHEPGGHIPPPLDVDAARARVETDARAWSSSLRVPALRGDAVMTSAMVLRGLVYAPTGALWAAATSSLPERVGGTLNWDYRFGWIRDTAFGVWAFLELGALDEAAALVDWLLRACAGQPHDIQPCYTVDGRRRLPEHVIEELNGYRGSRPVRSGNAAAMQVQMDVYGEILLSAMRLEECGRPLSDERWRVVASVADTIDREWREPGHGFWEERGKPEAFIGERVLTCVGLRAAARGAARRGDHRRDARYREIADRAEHSIRTSFVDPRTGTLVSGSRGRIGGTALWPIILGIVDADEPLAQRTVSAIERRLVRGGFVYRTSADVAHAGRPREGAFLPCTGWLARAQARCGNLEAAYASCDRLFSAANDVGIFSEEYDVKHRRALGNVPQAFTHAEAILTACELARAAQATAERRSASSAPSSRPHDARRTSPHTCP